MEKFYAACWTVGVIGVVGAICAAATVSCTNVNERYYQGMKACLSQGGSWVPNSQNGYSSSCINPHSVK